MLKRKKPSFYASIRLVIIGYAFMYDHLFWRLQLRVSEGSAPLYPGWLCYVFILLATPTLAGYQKSVTLLRPLAWYLGAVTLVRWIFQLVGRVPDGWYVYAVNVVTSVVVLYFHFQLLTNLANIAGRFSRERAHNLRLVRTLNLIVITLCSLPLPIADLGWDSWLVTGIILIIAAFLVLTARSEILGLRREILESICADTEVKPC